MLPIFRPKVRPPILLGMVSTAPSLHYTELALTSLFTHTPLVPDDTVILIDNDGSAADLAISHDPRISRTYLPFSPPEKPPQPSGRASGLMPG